MDPDSRQWRKVVVPAIILVLLVVLLVRLSLRPGLSEDVLDRIGGEQNLTTLTDPQTVTVHQADQRARVLDGERVEGLRGILLTDTTYRGEATGSDCGPEGILVLRFVHRGHQTMLTICRDRPQLRFDQNLWEAIDPAAHQRLIEIVDVHVPGGG